MPASTKSNAKAAKKTTAKKQPKVTAEPVAKKKLSALDAAARVLTENGGSMSTKEMIEAMTAKKLWQSPNGKTPAATLYAAILRELTTKGTDSRFKKTEPGRFAATGASSKTETHASTEQPKPPAKAKGKTTKVNATKGTKKKPAEPTATDAAIPDGTPGPESMQELVRL
jgi:hypothetical protein